MYSGNEGISNQHPKGCGKPDCDICANCDNEQANPHCSVCHGAGFIHPQDSNTGRVYWNKIIACPAAGCYGESLENKSSGRSLVLQKFENFKTRTKFPTVKQAFNVSKQFAEYWGEGREPRATPFLCLQGGVGVGKTHLGNAIGLHISKAGHAARVWNCGELIGWLQEGVKVNDINERLQEIKGIYCLILDDYKAEYSALYPWGVEKLEEIIDHRYRSLFATVLTTNNNLDQLPQRVMDRLLDMALATIIQIEARSYRPEKRTITT